MSQGSYRIANREEYYSSLTLAEFKSAVIMLKTKPIILPAFRQEFTNVIQAWLNEQTVVFKYDENEIDIPF